MTTYPTDVHGPASEARPQTNKVAKCNVCGFQWQMASFDSTDARGCPSCDAPRSAITIISEAPDYSNGAVID